MFFDIFLFFQILQNLGKADKTTDEIFEDHLQNFNTQQVRSIILASVSDPGPFFLRIRIRPFFWVRIQIHTQQNPDPVKKKIWIRIHKNAIKLCVQVKKIKIIFSTVNSELSCFLFWIRFFQNLIKEHHLCTCRPQ